MRNTVRMREQSGWDGDTETGSAEGKGGEHAPVLARGHHRSVTGLGERAQQCWMTVRTDRRVRRRRRRRAAGEQQQQRALERRPSLGAVARAQGQVLQLCREQHQTCTAVRELGATRGADVQQQLTCERAVVQRRAITRRRRRRRRRSSRQRDDQRAQSRLVTRGNGLQSNRTKKEYRTNATKTGANSYANESGGMCATQIERQRSETTAHSCTHMRRR
jgi:hypothetical protein